MSSNSRSRFRTASNILSQWQSNNHTANPGTEGFDQEPKIIDPVNCVGVWYGKMKTGSEHCWEATGAVREMFKNLSKEILDQLGGPPEPGDPIVAWSIYMIGKTKATAVPTLLFICEKRAARRFIKVQIEESGILDKYPNIRVGDCSKPPDFGRVTSLESLQDGKADRIKMLAGSQGKQDKYLLGNENTDLDVFIHRTNRLLGCRIFGASMWTATTGAFFQMHGRYFITTVNHAFTPPDKPSKVDPDDEESDSEFEFETQGLEPETEADSFIIDIEDSGFNDSPLSLHLSSGDQPSFTGELFKLGEVIFSATDAGNPGIDFSLIEIDEHNTKMSGEVIFAGLPSYTDLKRQIATEPADIYVKVVTASNFLEGRMTGTPTFIRCPGGVGFQEVWTVRFDGQLSQGEGKMPNVGHRPEEVENRLPISSSERKVRQTGLWPRHRARYPTSRQYKRKKPVSGSNLTRKRGTSHVTPCRGKGAATHSYSPSFLTSTNLQNEGEWTKQSAHSKGGSPNPLPVVLQETASLYEIEVLEKFLRGTSIKDVEGGMGGEGTLRAAWLDERTNPILEGSEDARFHNNPLTATGLLHALKTPLFDSEKEVDAEPDVMRRLICINDLSPSFTHALIAAAPVGESKALRSAICAHLAFQASIKVKTQSEGLPGFRLEFHLPYFALRKCSLDQSGDEKIFLGKANATSRKRSRYRDVSFLRLDSIDFSDSDSQGSHERWGLHECHVSVFITGRDNVQWTAYSFADTDLDGQRHEEIDGFDPIVRLFADYPIWTPHDYFLLSLQFQAKEVLKEWQYLVYNLEVSIEQYSQKNNAAFSHRFTSPREPAQRMKEAFGWSCQMVKFLSDLAHVLSGTVRQFSILFTTYANIMQFLDTGTSAISVDARRRLTKINKTVRELELLQHKMSWLKDSCNEERLVLQLWLEIKRNEATETRRFTNDAVIWVLVPFALSASIFSMNPAVIPFNMTPAWYILTVFLVTGMILILRFIRRNYHRFKWNIACWLKIFMRQDRLEHGSGFASGTYTKISNDDEKLRDIEAFGSRVVRC